MNGTFISVSMTGKTVPGQPLITVELMGQPLSIEIRVSRNGVELASETIMPEYDGVYYPNGRECPPKCTDGIEYPRTLVI